MCGNNTFSATNCKLHLPRKRAKCDHHQNLGFCFRRNLLSSEQRRPLKFLPPCRLGGAPIRSADNTARWVQPLNRSLNVSCITVAPGSYPKTPDSESERWRVDVTTMNEKFPACSSFRCWQIFPSTFPVWKTYSFAQNGQLRLSCCHHKISKINPTRYPAHVLARLSQVQLFCNPYEVRAKAFNWDRDQAQMWNGMWREVVHRFSIRYDKKLHDIRKNPVNGSTHSQLVNIQSCVYGAMPLTNAYPFFRV